MHLATLNAYVDIIKLLLTHKRIDIESKDDIHIFIFKSNSTIFFYCYPSHLWRTPVQIAQNKKIESLFPIYKNYSCNIS